MFPWPYIKSVTSQCYSASILCSPHADLEHQEQLLTQSFSGFYVLLPFIIMHEDVDMLIEAFALRIYLKNSISQELHVYQIT